MKKLALILFMFGISFANQQGKIDMHGGKSQNYGGFSKSFVDNNSSEFKKQQ